MEHRIRGRHRVLRAFREEHAGSHSVEFTDPLQDEPMNVVLTVTIDDFNSLADGEKGESK